MINVILNGSCSGVSGEMCALPDLKPHRNEALTLTPVPAYYSYFSSMDDSCRKTGVSSFFRRFFYAGVKGRRLCQNM